MSDSTEQKPAQQLSADSYKPSADKDPVKMAGADMPLARTDIGFAERFAFQHKDKAIHQADANVWLVWDGKRWKPDQNQVLMRNLGMKTARSIMLELAALPADSALRVPLVKFAIHSESKQSINSGIQLVTSLGLSKPLSIFDTNHYLFNCANGTIDLKTGDLLPHRKEDYITKISPVEYDENAKDPLFSQFIENVTNGDKELEAYLQRAAGYSLTGQISAKCLFIVYSEMTDTGKSSFVEGMLSIAGDYGLSLDIETLLNNDSGHTSARYDLAKLQGIRLACVSESAPGREFSGECIKRLTGGDTIRAREIHQSSIQFAPTHKIWICTNYAPAPTDGGDTATWNRLRRVPFNYQIPADKKDPHVKQALADPTSPTCRAFLAWAVEGVSMWLSNTLGTCKAVEDSTAEYRDESDPLADFMADCCVVHPDNRVSAKDIYERYLEWCKEQQIRYQFGRSKLGRCLKLKGFHSKKDGHGFNVWLGLSTKDSSYDNIIPPPNSTHDD